MWFYERYFWNDKEIVHSFIQNQEELNICFLKYIVYYTCIIFFVVFLELDLHCTNEIL